MNEKAKPAGVLKSMLASLKSATLTARGRIAQLDAQIGELSAKRNVLERALPHVDDLAAWVCRNIDRHRDFFFDRAATYLHPSLVRERGLSLLDDPEVRELGFGLFRVDHNISTVKGYPTPLDRDELRGAPIDPSGLVALLAEPLKTGARDFILRLLPDTANGMRRADRDREIETIDVQLRALLDERQEIIDNLHAAGTSTAG